MENKINIKLPQVEEIKVDINGTEITLLSYIDIEKYEIIAEDIRNTILYNPEIIDKYAMLQIRINRDILELCSNVNIEVLGGKDFFSPYIINLLKTIENYEDVKLCLDKEYQKYIIENSFGILAQKIPNEQEMSLSMDKLAKTIEGLPEDKLELIAKSIAWNNAPALGSMAAPITHIEAGE